MSRRGRKRKAGARHPCGKLKATRREPDRVEPTAQMKRHKAIASGGEVGNPLSYLPIADEYRTALDLFFDHKRSAGWGVRCKVATLDDSPRGPVIDPEVEAADDLIRASRYEEADAALMQAGIAAHRQVHNLFVFRKMTGNQADLEAGARALCEHYRIDLEDVA